MKKEKCRGAGAAGALIALLLLFAALTGCVYALASDGAGMARRMRAAAPEETTGLPDAEYGGMTRMITGYLTGRAESFQYIFTDAAGTERLCFQPHEQAHMADCRALIRLDRVIFGILAAAGAAGLILALLRIRTHPDCADPFLKGALRGIAAAAILTGGMILWGAIDFEGLFLTFHRIAFPGGGYWLDPRTDLLIRLMPESFFTGYGVTGVLIWTGLLIFPALTVTALRRKQRRIKS